MKAAILVLVLLNLGFASLSPIQVKSPNEGKDKILPLTFEPNRGQANAGVQFVSRTPDAAFFFSSCDLAVGLAKDRNRSTGFRIVFEGCSERPILKGQKAVPSKSNYLDLNKPSRSMTGIENHAALGALPSHLTTRRLRLGIRHFAQKDESEARLEAALDRG